MNKINAKEKRKRVRSPNFPAIDLQEALKRAKEFHNHEDRHPANIEVASRHWGYKNYNSGGSVVIAALISFGLMESEGVGSSRRIKLSPLGLRIVLDPRPISEERTQGLQKAALTPKIHQELWELWGKSLPSQENMQYHLLTRGFNRGTVDKFIEEYKNTLAFAGLLEDSKISPANEEEHVRVGDYVQWTSQGVDQFEEPRRVRELSPDGTFIFVDDSETGIPIEEVVKCDAPTGEKENGNSGRIIAAKRLPPKPGMNNEVFALEEGDIVLQWPSKLSPEGFKDLEAWLKIILRKAKRAAGIKDEKPQPPPADS